MAETISRIYLEAYETNKQFGKILLVAFLAVFVVPFVAIQAMSLTGSGDVSTQKYARILGMMGTHPAAHAHFRAEANPSFVPLPADRPSRIKGAWNMRKQQIVVPRPDAPPTVMEDRPSRLKGILNMRAGGIY